MQGNLTRFSGFASDYNAYRPGPPAVLKEILMQMAQTSRAALVVDIGCGTGLSTRYWAGSAEKVIGVEPNDDMRVQAVSATDDASVCYHKGLSSETGLADACADIVTCSQSLHWMEPGSTFREIARILRPGGVFAAYDYDWPPTTGIWQADQAYTAFKERLSAVNRAESDKQRIQKWAKPQHLKRMTESGCFRYTKELALHHSEDGSADRLVGLLFSQSGIRALLKAGHTETELGLDRFRKQCREILGDRPKRWYWSSRVRIGIK